MPVKLAYITPAFNEQDCIDPFVERITKVLDGLEDRPDWRLIFVDNGSSDETYQRLLALHERDSRFKLLRLSRNFGYQGAMLAGLTEAKADVYGFIDIDCEDPPELIPEFWARYKEGYQVIYGIRSNRDEAAWMVFLRRLFYKLNSLVSDFGAVKWMAEFGLYTDDVRTAVLSQTTSFRFLRNEIAALGFRRIGVNYRRARRITGKSHYNVWGATKFAVAGLLASSTLPLRLSLYLIPLFVVLFCLAAARFAGTGLVLAWLVLIFAYQVITIPMIALYLARTYKNTVGFPLYAVDRLSSRL